jgi:predicted ATP-dependent protease
VDVPEDVRQQLRIVPVETMDQVLEEALIDQARPAERIKAERDARQKRVTKRRRGEKKEQPPIAAAPPPPVDQPPAGAA